MMNSTLDLKKPYTTVGGRNPLYYIQNGHGFNRAGEYLGECNSQGEIVATSQAVEEQPDPAADEKASDAPDAEAQSPKDSVVQQEELYKGVKSATMKKMIEERGLTYEPDADRDALVAILVADDNAK